MNITALLDNVSLFYENIHILSQNTHCVSIFRSLWKDISSRDMHQKQNHFPSVALTTALAHSTSMTGQCTILISNSLYVLLRKDF